MALVVFELATAALEALSGKSHIAVEAVNWPVFWVAAFLPALFWVVESVIAHSTQSRDLKLDAAHNAADALTSVIVMLTAALAYVSMASGLKAAFVIASTITAIGLIAREIGDLLQEIKALFVLWLRQEIMKTAKPLARFQGSLLGGRPVLDSVFSNSAPDFSEETLEQKIQRLESRVEELEQQRNEHN